MSGRMSGPERKRVVKPGSCPHAESIRAATTVTVVKLACPQAPPSHVPSAPPFQHAFRSPCPSTSSVTDVNSNSDSEPEAQTQAWLPTVTHIHTHDSAATTQAGKFNTIVLPVGHYAEWEIHCPDSTCDSDESADSLCTTAKVDDTMEHLTKLNLVKRVWGDLSTVPFSVSESNPKSRIPGPDPASVEVPLVPWEVHSIHAGQPSTSGCSYSTTVVPVLTDFTFAKQ